MPGPRTACLPLGCPLLLPSDSARAGRQHCGLALHATQRGPLEGQVLRALLLPRETWVECPSPACGLGQGQWRVRPNRYPSLPDILPLKRKEAKQKGKRSCQDSPLCVSGNGLLAVPGPALWSPRGRPGAGLLPTSLHHCPERVLGRRLAHALGGTLQAAFFHFRFAFLPRAQVWMGQPPGWLAGDPDACSPGDQGGRAGQLRATSGSTGGGSLLAEADPGPAASQARPSAPPSCLPG